jgi:hypothetical protein
MRTQIEMYIGLTFFVLFILASVSLLSWAEGFPSLMMLFFAFISGELYRTRKIQVDHGKG